MTRRRTQQNNADPNLVNAVKKDILADMHYYRDNMEDANGWFAAGRPARAVRDKHRAMRQLRQDVRREMQSVKRIEDRLGRVRNPQVRRMVYEILEEANDQGLTVNDILQSFPRRRGLGDILGMGSDKSLYWIIGASILGLALFPTAKNNLKGIMSNLAKGSMDISDKLQTMVAEAKEGIEDIVAEAQFQKMQDSMLDNPTKS
ncbi:hypothetical protein SAMN05660649_02875 [Desulfotomaculum arcticum]|uniref:Uncharacterized protein n=1 Tax=Desulfotruncus arcticus DSM 17038 TaxID=1121424 RepID=A0A1I2V3F4_9FIRM|nr:hypothetical protein [Desulfotruncus arcticus]SFG83710.1 hypothetical protein SAMN05660649_02875 [Desulfotomaculum arcticum] [Desulfotruncus arcticus DSM 17038]